MSIKNYFNYKAEIFGYSWIKGDDTCYGWPINYSRYNNSIDILALNSKEYELYINHYFYDKLKIIYGNDVMARKYKPTLVLQEDENGVKTLRISHIHYLKVLIKEMTNNEYSDIDKITDNSIDNLIEVAKKAFLEDINIYDDVLNNGKNSRYYNHVMEEYYKLGKNADIREFLVINMHVAKAYLEKLNYIKPLFEQQLDFDEFAKCFDYDQLMLIISKSFIDYCEDVSKIDGEPDYCICYVKRYIDTLKKYLELEPNYYCSIMTEKGKFSTIKLMKQCDKFFDSLGVDAFINCHLNEEFLTRNNLTNEELNKLNPKEFTNLIFMLQEKNLSEDVNQESIKKDINDLEEQINKTDDNSLRLKLIQQKEKIEFLLNNEPVKILHGSESFSNYYGYVYDNGYVVFDVLDKNFNKSYGNAMYIMAYDKINDYSKKSKTEIRNSKFSDVSVIMHSGNWKERLLDKLNKLESIKINLDNISSLEINNITNIEELNIIKERLSELSEQNKELLKEKEKRIVEYNKIDNELKEYQKIKISEEKLEKITSEFIEEISGKKLSFTEMYNYGKKQLEEEKEEESKDKEVNEAKEKRKQAYYRRKVVKAYTKERSKDENGDYTCALCGFKHFDERAFDSHHVIPLAKGGPDNIYNTACLCVSCHVLYHRRGYTYNQLYELFDTIKNQLIERDIEFLPLFEEMVNPYAENNDCYLKQKKDIDRNFSVTWNCTRKLKK